MMRKKRKRQTTPTDELVEMVAFTRRNKKYRGLHEPLTALQAMIGMTEVKKSIVSQIHFLIANDGKLDDHFLNTSISGPPGTGKTSIARILFNIWNAIDIFKDKDRTFHILHRSDFVGSYMGHTSNKTKKMLQKHAGNVLFIDEAYSLVTGERDEDGQEALHQLNAFMSEEKSNTVVIIAGYEDQLEESFFSCNQGLKRRFGWHFIVEPYNAQELYKIFLLQLKKNGWTVEDCEKLFVNNKEKFENAGGDCENIAFKAKLEYSKRVWNKKKKTKRLTLLDVKSGFEKHFVHKKTPVESTMYI